MREHAYISNNKMSITDNFGRTVTNLRISITPRCNLNCFYCHREGESKPTKEVREMNAEEIAILSKIFSRLGITKLKLTGGEPLIRTDIENIIIACRPYFKEISLTTNGYLLSTRAESLKNAGLDRINISLDTLKPNIYKKITGFSGLKKVIDGISASHRYGLSPVKVNMVVMKEINEDEIYDMATFCAFNNSILQLIELETNRENEKKDFYKQYHVNLEPIEYELSKLAYFAVTRKFQNRKKYVIPIRETLARCKRKSIIEKKINKLNGKLNAEIEVVRSMHNTSFCANCTRVRITSDGYLKPCLLSSVNYLDLISLIKESSEDKVMDTLRKELANREPYWR